MNRLKILMAASEAEPYARTGGLGDVMGALPGALAERGHEVRVVLPRYGTIDGPAVMRALGEAEYEGLFNLEIPGERHALLPLRALKSRHARQVAEWLVGL